jgi:hypothetical protein
MIRTMRPFDWKAQLKKLMPQLEEVCYAGKTYLKLPYSTAFFLTDNPKAACYCYQPDDRTLVMDTDSNIRRVIDGKAESPRRAWSADWKRVERCAIAYAMDLTDKRWLADRRQPEKGLSAGELMVLKNTTSAVFGVDVADNITVESVVRCPGAKVGNEVAHEVESWVAKGREELAEELKKCEAGSAEFVWGQFQRDLLSNARARREGDIFRWQTEARLDFAALARHLLAAEDSLREMEKQIRSNTDK